MRFLNKIVVLVSFLLFSILLVGGSNFPLVDDMPIVGADIGTWGNKLLRMHNKTVETIQVSLTENGTLKSGIVHDRILNLSNITLLDFSNDAGFLTIVGNVNLATGTIKAEKLNLSDIKLSTFTNDFGYSTITNGTIQIGTSQVTNLVSFIIANEINPSNSTIQIGTSQITNLASFVIANEQNPKNATIQIGTSQVTGLSDFVIANEINPKNSTLQIGTNQVTGLADFVVDNEKNPSNSTILITLGQVNGRDFTDGLLIGSGTNITKHISVSSANVVTANIGATACGDLTATGITASASVGDTVVASPSAVASGIETTNLIWNAYVSATNTVKIRACNPTAAGIDILDTQTWRIDVWKH